MFAVAVLASRLLAADAPRARPSRSPRADLAAARVGLARAQSRPRGDRGDVPRREPRPGAVRVAYRSTLLQGQRDEAPSRCPPRTSSPRTSPSSCLSCTGPPGRCPATPLRSCASRATSRRGRPSASSPSREARCPPCRGGGATSHTGRSPRSAAKLTPRYAGLQLLALPAGRRFTLPGGDRRQLGIRAFFRSRLGDYVAVSLGKHAPRRVILRGRIPFRHATLTELELDILNGGRLTANAGTGIQPSAKGALVFGTPRVNGRPVSGGFARWTGTGGVGGSAAKLGYVLTPDGPGVPSDAADRRPADAGARHAEARRRRRPARDHPARHRGRSVAGRVVGVVQRFPSITGDAVVADLEQAGTRLDTLSAGPRHRRRALALGQHPRRTCPSSRFSRTPNARPAPVRPTRARSAADTRRHRGGCALLALLGLSCRS